jgi:hypothetical protein
MAEIDPFDKAFNDWLRGVHQDAKARQEDHNLTMLVNTLQQRGHTIKFDNLGYYIFVDVETENPLTITMQNAREMDTETLFKWVEQQTVKRARSILDE